MDKGGFARRVALAGTGLMLGSAVGAVPAATAKPPTATARARQGLLSPSSFPPGWTPSAGAGDAGQAVGPRQIAACTGAGAAAILAHPPSATSPQFDEAGGERAVDEQVQVYPTVAAARAALGVMAGPKAPACAAAYLNGRAASATGPAGTYTVSRLAAPLSFSRSCALLLSLSVPQNGGTATAQAEDVVIENGRTDATLLLTSTGSPFPASLVRRLASAAARRIG